MNGPTQLVTVRSAAILTNSYVAGTIIGPDSKTLQYNQLCLECDFTKGSLTSLEIKIEYSNDGVTYRQLANELIEDGVTTLTPAEYTMLCSTLGATQNFVIERPLRYSYIKISAKGTGTVTDSSLTIKAILSSDF